MRLTIRKYTICTHTLHYFLSLFSLKLTWLGSSFYFWCIFCSDQRISQDVERFCDKFSTAMQKLILWPFIVSYYTYKTYVTWVWVVNACCVTEDILMKKFVANLSLVNYLCVSNFHSKSLLLFVVKSYARKYNMPYYRIAGWDILECCPFMAYMQSSQ